jgi:TPR repeat protein
MKLCSVIVRWSAITGWAAMMIAGTASPGHAEFLQFPPLPAVISTEEAYQSWLPSALAGSPSCQYNIGLLYLYGVGKPRDPQVAANWLRRAAAAEYRPAQYLLATLLLDGEAIERDVEAAHHWFLRAAEQDDANATFRLAGLYAGGLLGAPDLEKARVSLNRAAELGHLEAALLREHQSRRLRTLPQ